MLYRNHDIRASKNKGGGTMEQVELRQTDFRVEKLMNVVGVGRCSAYSVITTPGTRIGHVGPMANLQLITAHNDDHFSVASARSGPARGIGRWLRRALRGRLAP
jgi:hypothetical protein